MAGCWFCQATSIQNACLELWLLVVVIGVFGVVAHNDECFITFHFLPKFHCQSQMVVVVAAVALEMELFAWYMQLHLHWKRTQYVLLNMLILQQRQLQDTLLIDMYHLVQTSTCFIPFWTPSKSLNCLASKCCLGLRFADAGDCQSNRCERCQPRLSTDRPLDGQFFHLLF